MVETPQAASSSSSDGQLVDDPPVTALMRTDVPVLKPTDRIGVVARALADHGLTGLPVVEQGKMVGIITESDLIAREAEVEVPMVLPFLDAIFRADAGRKFDDEVRKALATTAGELMNSHVVSVRSDATLSQVATVMVERKLNILPVVDDRDQIIGIISRSDLVRYIAKLEEIVPIAP